MSVAVDNVFDESMPPEMLQKQVCMLVDSQSAHTNAHTHMYIYIYLYINSLTRRMYARTQHANYTRARTCAQLFVGCIISTFWNFLLILLLPLCNLRQHLLVHAYKHMRTCTHACTHVHAHARAYSKCLIFLLYSSMFQNELVTYYSKYAHRVDMNEIWRVCLPVNPSSPTAKVQIAPCSRLQKLQNSLRLHGCFPSSYDADRVDVFLKELAESISQKWKWIVFLIFPAEASSRKQTFCLFSINMYIMLHSGRLLR